MQALDMHFFLSRRAGGCFLSYFSCHSSQTLCVLNTVTCKFDLCCRPLSAQRACMANTRDAPTNFMSEVCMEQPMLSQALYYTRYQG